MYIAIEGTDGTGKSTQVEALKKWLQDYYEFSVSDVHDPDSNFKISKNIRDLWRSNNKIFDIDIWAMLFSVSSIAGQHFENGVMNKLNTCDVVISDRSGLSNYAYFWKLELIEYLDDFHKLYVKPDLIIFLECDSSDIHKRLNSRVDENSPGINSIVTLQNNYKNAIKHLSASGWNIAQYKQELNEDIYKTTENLKEIILKYTSLKNHSE